jgi:kinesin family member 2/24
MEEQKVNKRERQMANEIAGRNIDADFDIMIEKSRLQVSDIRPQMSTANIKIDAVSAANPIVRVHECKYKVDGITKVVENHDFTFDNVFGREPTQALYEASLKPNMNLPFTRGGVVTCFAYG